jgi:hypothetical protein
MGKAGSVIGLSLGLLWITSTAAAIFFSLYVGLMSLLFPDKNPLTMSRNTDHWTSMICGRFERASAMSPDGAMKALMVDFDCGGFGIVQTGTAVAILESRQDWPSLDTEVFSSGELYDRDTTAARLEWIDARHLRITVPNDLGINSYKAIEGKVAIEIKFDPDDPVARERFMRERDERLGYDKSSVKP